MGTLGAKAVSVSREGDPDGWVAARGYRAEMDHSGATRLVVSTPPTELRDVYPRLIMAMKAPLSVLYRQVVDRRDPKPQGAPPRDFLALGVDPEGVVAALERHGSVVYHDARCELWLRGVLHEQLVIDPDGLMYCYPDDPAFREVLADLGIMETEVETMLERDYVRHHFHAECDAAEDGLIAELNLTEVASRRP